MSTTKYRVTLTIDQFQEKQQQIENELLSIPEAQALTVHREKKFLSPEEIEKIFTFEKEYRNQMGCYFRDEKGFKKMNSNWSTSYLHTNNLFSQHFHDLEKRIKEIAVKADFKEGWGILNGSSDNLNLRVVELHSVTKGGGLVDTKHLDHGSLITVDIMLYDGFTGGEFNTLEKSSSHLAKHNPITNENSPDTNVVVFNDGKIRKDDTDRYSNSISKITKDSTNNDTFLKSHAFELGDAVIFPSHKYHCVQPVTSGLRRVMVIELWRGEQRTCAHRCQTHLGDCNYSVYQSKIENLLTAAHPEVDPW